MDTVTRFLAIQSSYSDVECAFFHNNVLIDTCRIDKVGASSLLVPMVAELLQRYACTLTDLDFIAVNIGPAPFTTLRVVIATANGLQYAYPVPLVGVTAFDGWFHQLPLANDAAIVMNAFNDELYYAVRRAHQSHYSSGYAKVAEVAQRLVDTGSSALQVVGNAVALHESYFKACLGDRMIVDTNNRSMCEVTSIGLVGLQQWQEGSGSREPLVPLYLKPSFSHSR